MNDIIEIKSLDNLKDKDFCKLEIEGTVNNIIGFFLYNNEINTNNTRIIVNDKLKEEDIDYRVEMLFMTFLCRIEKGKKRFDIGNKLINRILEKEDYILSIEKSNLMDYLLNEIIEYSCGTDQRIEEISEFTYKYLKKNKSFFNMTRKVVQLLKKINQYKKIKKFEKLMIEYVEDKYKGNSEKIIEKFIDDISHCKFDIINKDFLYVKLGLTCLNMGDGLNDIIKIKYYNKASESFIKGKEDYLNKLALSKLENTITKLDKEQLNVVGLRIPNHIDSILKKRTLFMEKYFEFSSIEYLINKIGSCVVCDKEGKEEFIYQPYINFKESINIERSKYNLETVFKRTILGRNRVMQIGNNNEINDMRLAYQIHFKYNVKIVMDWIYKNNIIALKEVRRIFRKSQFVDEGTYEYYLKIEKHYNKKSACEFITLGVILAEKIIRNISKVINNKTIVNQRRDKRVQFDSNLQELLKDDNIKKFLGDDLYQYIDYILINDKGLNLRNNALHGLLDMNDYNELYMNVIMQINLILAIGEYIK